MDRPTPGIGHNSLNRDPDYGFRRHAWTRARAALVKPAAIEVVRRQVRRAQALGLDYKRYSTIVLATGRDITALIVTDRAVGATAAAPRVARLAQVRDCALMLMAPDAERLARRLIQQGLTLAEVAAPPPPGAADPQARATLRDLLNRRLLPSDAVALIGEGAAQKGWAEAARLAAFIPASRYFAETPAATV
jgi:hypothetical protein